MPNSQELLEQISNGQKTLNQAREELGLEPIEDERGREKIVYSSSPIEISHESVIDSARLLKDININLAEALGSGEHEKDLMIIHEIRENCKMIKLLLEHRICPISQEKKGIFSKKGKSKGGYCAYGPPNEL
ncbi:Hypothetical protein DPCES_2282 [Desulfitobacterium hafniense]|uniref:Uncharacterized protein n=1 Tax=Desulfitobacterium hafniense TaxID=49338 RepID=A0A098AZV2_DESHA|nr:hypothetical protein [Desulfitobacterium hafniense]CDX02169.1 Hypothetical protein DPCES_2282 [Desulfitobacterium hafniense]